MTLTSSATDFEILDSPEPFEICIIGSGFVGTILGKELAARGIRTLILESGRSLSQWFFDSRLKGLAAYEVSGDADYLTELTKARAWGGNSNFWTGRCERLHPSDLKVNPYTPPDNPWPITYEELEPYWERAESTLRVRGGALSTYAPPRRRDLPLPARSNISSLKSMLQGVDITVDQSATATPTKALRFFRLHKEILPALRSSSDIHLLSDATVTRLLPDAEGRIVGAEVRKLDGATKIARARTYVVACGGIETPRLLLLSRSDMFPAGIGNRHDRVGRGFNEHPGVNFYAKIRHTWDTIYPRHKLGRTHQFYDSFREQKLGSVLPVFIQSWLFPNHLIRPSLATFRRDIASLLSRVTRPILYIGATIEMAPRDGNRVTLSRDKVDQFGSPLAHLSLSFSPEDRQTLDRTRELILDIYRRIGATGIEEGEVTWSRHHIGACRMGDDPETSVADRNLRVHESPNLYLCGSETFVTGAAVPPVLTIVALTHRLADHLLDQARDR